MRLVRILAVLLFASSAFAQINNTFVSYTGNDSDPCTHPLPCRTFAAALSKTVRGGAITPLDSAGYGTLNITNSITIDGGPYFATMHGPGLDSIVINITDFVNDPNATVILRNLEIAGYENGTTGIRILSAKKVIIENCKIYAFRNGAARGIDINTIVPNLSVSILDSTISGNGAQGIYSHSGAASPVTLAIEDTRIVQNDSSAIDLHAMTKATVVRCALNQNGSAGLYAEVASTDADVANTSMEHNIIAVSAGSGASVRLSGSSLTHNVTSVAGNVLSHGNNAIVNNTFNTLPALLPPPAMQ